MNKFIISIDSSTDQFKNFAKSGVYYVVIKRVLNGKEYGDNFETPKEYEYFYNNLKSGMPTTVALNPFELREHFEGILKREKTGDIIHVSLSSGLSATCDNAVKAANELNAQNTGRKVYVFDSLVATAGLNMLVDELIKLRDAGAEVPAALKRLEDLREHQQGWAVMSDLFNLKRGGRISGVKATIGTILNIKPIIMITPKGKLAIQNKMRGNLNSINYMLGKIEELGVRANPNFLKSKVYLAHSTSSNMFCEFRAAFVKKYPTVKIAESIVCPIVGVHLGAGALVIIFEGAKRLEIKE
jgi:DegV family protein with EDD domain